MAVIVNPTKYIHLAMPGRTSVTQMGAMMLQQLVEPADCGQLAGCRVCMRGLLERCLQLLGRLLGLD